MQETPKWLEYQIAHYIKQGWSKDQLDERYKRLPFQVIIDNYTNYGGDALGHKDEPYFEKESDYEYVPPTYSDLSKLEKKIYKGLKL